jgi:hypothetical protein
MPREDEQSTPPPIRLLGVQNRANITSIESLPVPVEHISSARVDPKKSAVKKEEPRAVFATKWKE